MTLTLLFHQLLAPPKPWDLQAYPETASTLSLVTDTVVRYPDGSSDTLSAATLALLPDGVTQQFDRTRNRWIGYTAQGSGVLSVVAEVQLSSLDGAICPLCRVLLHEVTEYLPSQVGVAADPGPPVGDSLDPPVWIAPPDTATDVDRDVTLAWTAPAGATLYHLQVATDAGFTALVANVTQSGTTWLPSPSLPASTLLYARVNAGNGFVLSAWVAESFTTGTTASGGTTLPCGAFNGTDAYLDVAADVPFGAGDFSVGMWIATGESAVGTLWCSGYNGTDSSIVLIYVEGGVGVHAVTNTPVAGGPYILGPGPLTFIGPHLVVLTMDRAGNQVLYLDGAVVTTLAAPVSGSVTGAGAVTRMGRVYAGTPDNYYAGAMWGVGTYVGHALSHAEVLTWFAAGDGNGVPPGSPTNYWSFLEGGGDTVHDTQGGNTGTFHGSPPHWSTR